ncbi:MAG: sulfite exporter TauE/SafE family protein [Gammaproteobacteria bacterium]|nr:sulfite exporter TauE/SafE family protein [Gammaproteobacteria bacterium]
MSFESITPAFLLFGAFTLLVAYLVRGIAGFGSGLIAIPLLALVLPLTVAVPLVVFLDYVASATHGLKDRAQICWREILPLLPFTAVGVLLGLYLFRSVDAVLLAHALGVFVLLYASYSLFFKDSLGIVSRRWSAVAGLLGGLIGTLFGTGGPFYVLYLKHRGLDKTQFRATFATIFLLDGAGRLTGYLSGGFFDRDWITLAALSLPLMAVGLYLGGHVHTTISQRAFHVAVSSLLVISGVSLLLRH